MGGSTVSEDFVGTTWLDLVRCSSMHTEPPLESVRVEARTLCLLQMICAAFEVDDEAGICVYSCSNGNVILGLLRSGLRWSFSTSRLTFVGRDVAVTEEGSIRIWMGCCSKHTYDTTASASGPFMLRWVSLDEPAWTGVLPIGLEQGGLIIPLMKPAGEEGIIHASWGPLPRMSPGGLSVAGIMQRVNYFYSRVAPSRVGDKLCYRCYCISALLGLSVSKTLPEEVPFEVDEDFIH